jgi:hypothetical protein
LSGSAGISASFRSASTRVCESCPAMAGIACCTKVRPDTGRNETAGDVIVLRVFGPGQDRGTL